MVKVFLVLVLGSMFGSFLEGSPDVLTVRVYESGSGSPISSAKVSLMYQGRLVAEAETGDDGLANFVGTEPSRYVVRINSLGYRDLLDPDGTGRMFSFRLPGQSQFAVALLRTAAISGSVYRSDGQAATGVQVVALARRTAHGRARLIADAAVPPARTDDRGFYRLYNLLPGTYTIAAVPSPNGSGTEEVLAPSFFRSAAVPSSAEFFELRPGEERGETVLGLAEGETHQLSGEILGIPSSWRGERASVTLFSIGAFRSPLASTMTDPKGRFSFPSLPPGGYQITAFGPDSSVNESGSIAPDERSASQAISLGAGDQHIEMTLQDLPQLEGEIIFRDGASRALCGAADKVSFHPEDGWLDVLPPRRFSVAIGSRDFRFRLKAIPAGQYAIEIPGLVEPCHLAQTLVGNQEAQPESGPPLLNGSAPIKLVVSAAAGSLSGAIVGEEKHPQGLVLLVREDGGYPPRVIPIDAASRYQFNNLPPGRYILLLRRD